jgi:hypothetical protein
MSDRLALLRRSLSAELLAALEEHVRDIAAEAVRDAFIEHEPKRRWITLEEAAEQMGCSYDAMRMRAKRKRVVTDRQGRTVYVLAESLRELDGR